MKPPTICRVSIQILLKQLTPLRLILISYNFRLGAMWHRDSAGSLFLRIQFGTGVQDGGWRGCGTQLAGNTTQVSYTVNSLVFILQVVSLFWCFITAAWDVFFPAMRNKFILQYSYYSNGVRHTCLISVLAFLESFLDYVSCCVQNSHLLNKTVSTPVHPPSQAITIANFQIKILQLF